MNYDWDALLKAIATREAELIQEVEVFEANLKRLNVGLRAAVDMTGGNHKIVYQKWPSGVWGVGFVEIFEGKDKGSWQFKDAPRHLRVRLPKYLDRLCEALYLTAGAHIVRLEKATEEMKKINEVTTEK